MQLFGSDAHRGTTAAVSGVLQGRTWQRCWVHVMRSLLTAARHKHRYLIAALIRTVFAQLDNDRARIDDIAAQLKPFEPDAVVPRGRGRRPARLHGVPARALAKIRLNNPIERLNREMGRRTNVVGIYPNTESVIRRLPSRSTTTRPNSTTAHMAARTLASLVNNPTLTTLPAAPQRRPIAHSDTTSLEITGRRACPHDPCPIGRCTSQSDWRTGLTRCPLVRPPRES